MLFDEDTHTFVFSLNFFFFLHEKNTLQGKLWKRLRASVHLTWILCKTLALDKVITRLEIAGSSQGLCEHHCTHCCKESLHSLQHFTKNYQGVFSHTCMGHSLPALCFSRCLASGHVLRGLQGWFLVS